MPESPAPAENAPPAPAPVAAPLPLGLRLARWAGLALGALLCLWLAPAALRESLPQRDVGNFVKALFFVAYGGLLLLPWRGLADWKGWGRAFAALAALSAAFAFVMVFEALHDYIRLMERGVKPRLPAFKGMLVFVALLQPFAVWFLRRPEDLQ